MIFLNTVKETMLASRWHIYKYIYKKERNTNISLVIQMIYRLSKFEKIIIDIHTNACYTVALYDSVWSSSQ